MRAVVQRVTRASVTIDRARVGAIETGLLVLVGVAVDDDASDAAAMAHKIGGLRIFDDAGGAMNLALADVGGASRNSRCSATRVAAGVPRSSVRRAVRRPSTSTRTSRARCGRPVIAWKRACSAPTWRSNSSTTVR